MNEIEQAARKERAKTVYRLFCYEARALGFKGTRKLYRDDGTVQPQIRLEKSTYGGNLYRLSLSIHLFREGEDHRHFYEIPDITVGDQAVSKDSGDALDLALDADSELTDQVRSATFRDFLVNGAEPWFRSFDTAEKMREFIISYEVQDVDKRRRGHPFRPIYDYLLGPNWTKSGEEPVQ